MIHHCVSGVASSAAGGCWGQANKRRQADYWNEYWSSMFCFSSPFLPPPFFPLFSFFSFLVLILGTVNVEIKVPSAEPPELSKVLSSKCGVGQNVPLRVSPTACNSLFLISALRVHSSTFSQILFQHKTTCDTESETDFYL